MQRIIADEALLDNVRALGPILAALLAQRLGGHAHVGDIRGRGFFWGLELVADKASARPFPADDHVAMELAELGLTAPYCIAVYPGSGGVDGVAGDHIILAPPYNITRADVDTIVDRTARLVEDYFAAKTAAPGSPEARSRSEIRCA